VIAVKRRHSQPPTPSVDPQLAALREKWGPEWRVWRSRNSRGEFNEWCATRRGVGRQLSMTLMEKTAGQLEKALVREADRTPIYG
jgi:hypothetical protein